MSTLTYLTSLVQQAISRLNNYEANAKKVDELPHQTTLEPTSKIPVSRAGISEHLTVQQIISSIQNSNYNQLLAVGTITVDGTDITVPSGVSGQINGLLYGTSTDTILSITLCPTGFSRKDIIVLTTANTVVVISGEETDGAIVLAPPVPTDALYITEFDVNDTAIGAPIDPTLGTQFKKKSENSSLKINATGEEQIINLSIGGQMHYIVASTALISVAGFSPHLLNMGGNALYPGQDLIFENQTGNPVTLINAHTIAPIKFNEGADIIVPNGGKIWFRINGGFASLMMKSWSDVDLSTKADLVDGKVPASQLPSYVDDVLEFANLAAFPAIGETGKIYVALDTNFTYRWSGSAYVQIGGVPSENVLNYFNGDIYISQATGSSISLIGYPAIPTLVGSVYNATANLSASYASTPAETWNRRTLSTGTTAGSSAENYWIRLVSISLGFYVSAKIAFIKSTNGRYFHGLTNYNSATGNVNPSTLTNLLGFASDSGDSNMQIIHNDNSGTAVKIDLGSNFSNSNHQEAYIFEIWNLKNSNIVYFRVKNLKTDVISPIISVTTDLPTITDGLLFRTWLNNGTDAFNNTLNWSNHTLKRQS